MLTTQHGTNLVILTGYLADPVELRTSSAGLDIVHFHLKTVQPIETDHGIEHEPHALPVTALRSAARSLATLGKGSLLTVRADLRALELDGTDPRSCEVVATTIDVLDAKRPATPFDRPAPLRFPAQA